MDNWSKSTKVTYKRWKDPGPGAEANSHGSENQAPADICTITSIVDSGAGHSTYGSTDAGETFSVDDALEAIGFGRFQWKISFLTGLSWIGDAMEMMILSILSPQLHCEWTLPGYKVALITSVVFIGMGISSPVWGNVSDRFGRKVGLAVCMCWSLYFGLLSAFAPVYGWLLALRGLVGFGIGGAPQSVTLYSEFLPTKSRGICIMLISAFWAIGAVFEVVLALLIMPTLGWRWLLGLSTIPMAIFVCLCFWLPESPRFDMLTGRRDRALATLTRIAKDNGKALPQGKLIPYRQNERGRIKDLFTPQYCSTTLLLWFIWFANAFSYYGIVLLTTEMYQAGDDCGGLFVIILGVEYLGRKKSMALCFFMFTLFILPLFACIGRSALTTFIFLARAFISAGYQVVFVYTPEVFPTENRALAMGTCSALAKLGALITPFVAQVMLRSSVYVTLTVYCACSVLAAVASLLLPIETLGRAMQESSFDQAAEEQTSDTISQSNGTVHSAEWE